MRLTVIHNDIDLTLKMDNFSSYSKEIDLSNGEIHIGYFKPLKNIYIELTSREVADEINLKYFNGSEFVDVPGLEDRTFGLTESGLIFWPEVHQVETTLNGKKAFWLKLTTSDEPALEVSGINLVLSNDKDFGFYPSIMELLPHNKHSFIGFHEEARNIIVQTIRNSGKRIKGYGLDAKQVDVFDLLSIEEFKQASKYLALHLIFDYLTKSSDDQYAFKARDYYQKYEKSLNDQLLTIDTNNNGQTDSGENMAIQFIRLRRE
jgi:hypothetical protein